MKPTHCEQIVDYMKEFGSINPLQALYDIGCFRLASRISDLKKQGYPIISERVNYKNRLGEAKHFNEYRLKED
jgi:hypothetical protein